MIDAIEAHEQKEAILLMLSENEIFFNQPDSNRDSLHHLLRSMASRSLTKVNSLLKVHKQARTQESSINTIYKDKSALMAYAQPYQFEALWQMALYKLLFMHQWQTCAMDIASPLLSHMVDILLYLASPKAVDSFIFWKLHT